MHLLILRNYNLSPNAQSILQPPLHQRMAPIRRTRIRYILGASTPANLPQRRPNKLPRIRDHQARLPNLAHRSRDQIAQAKLDIHATTRQLATKRRRPLLQECLAARVRCQQRRRQPPAETAHRENQPAFPLHHARGHNLRDSKRRGTVDRNDIPDLVFRRLHKRHWD